MKGLIVSINLLKLLRNQFVGKAVAAGLLVLSFAPPSMAGDAEIKRAIETMYPTAKVTTVSPTAVKGIYEVVVGVEIIYADESGKFIFYGPLVDVVNRKNLTEVRKEDLTRIDFKDLPLELAVKTVKGDGSRVFASFEDPNCGYCRQLHTGLKKVDNFTLYTFLTPMLSEDSKTKTRSIWCSPDRSGALEGWMTSGMVPAGSACDAPTAKVLELAARLGVKGTPTMFFESGKRAPGFLPMDQLEALLNGAKNQAKVASKIASGATP